MIRLRIYLESGRTAPTSVREVDVSEHPEVSINGCCGTISSSFDPDRGYKNSFTKQALARVLDLGRGFGKVFRSVHRRSDT